LTKLIVGVAALLGIISINEVLAKSNETKGFQKHTISPGLVMAGYQG